MLGISEYLLVYHTSGLTLSISGVFKEIIILTVSTTVVEKTQLDGLRLSGMALCVAGITVHSVLKAISARGISHRSHHLSYISVYCLYVRVIVM
jgi:solute carrier family 35 protein C2